MEPVFSLAWPEYVAAQRLQELFRRSENVSVHVPLSRSEKDTDLVIVRKLPGGMTRAITVQVKASRTYVGEPPKRKGKYERFANYTWFNRFTISDQADYYVLIGFYAPELASTRGHRDPRWYKDVILLFTNAEMKKFVDECRLVRSPEVQDRMFGFGFDSPQRICQTRGDSKRTFVEFTDRVLATQGPAVRSALGLPPIKESAQPVALKAAGKSA